MSSDSVNAECLCMDGTLDCPTIDSNQVFPTASFVFLYFPLFSYYSDFLLNLYYYIILVLKVEYSKFVCDHPRGNLLAYSRLPDKRRGWGRLFFPKNDPHQTLFEPPPPSRLLIF